MLFTGIINITNKDGDMMGSISVQFTWRHTHNENTVEKEHMHDAFEIVYYIRGEGDAVIGGKKYSYKAGTICYIPQGVLHSEYHKTETEVLFFAFNISEYLIGNVETNILPDKDGILLKKCMRIEEENTKRLPYYRVMISSLIEELLVLIIRLEKGDEREKNDPYKIIEEACAYIELNSNLNLSAIDIAKWYGYSYDYFRHIFKKYSGIGIKEFITSARKDMVIEYLLNTNKTIKEIAILCNFGGVQDLSKWFKNVSGISPLNYRKKYKHVDNRLQVKYTET